MVITKCEDVTKQVFCKILWRKFRLLASLLLVITQFQCTREADTACWMDVTGSRPAVWVWGGGGCGGGGRLFEAGRLCEVGANSRLGAYSNKYDISNASILSVTGWIVTDPFSLDQAPEVGKRGWGVIIKGMRLFWIFPSKGVILRGRQLIEGLLLLEEIRYEFFITCLP